ncbi:MAG: carboxypeptidase regulatory-like domain-containing protein, partial [Myxococcales bacterium]|nr:carboxypeptidase regulatory-like domain-containing protein [Myxococcales bacterium]
MLPLLLTVGCLRSTDPLPERPEGIVFTGQVVQRGGPSGDWTGAKGVAVTAAGIGVAATTNADGKFRLTRLPINHFITLRLTAARTSSAAQARLPQSRVLEPERALFDREVLDLGTIELGPGGALEGRALLSDGLGAPPVGVGGTLVVVPTTTFKAVTDVDGRFQLPDLPEGTFELVAFHPGYLPARLERVGVFPGGTINTKDLVLAKGAAQDVSVRGRARILGDDTDTGHAGITVRFGVEGTEDPIFETTTGPDGQYAASLAPGVYHVTATRDGYGKILLQGVAVLPEGVLGLVDIYLAAPTDGDGDGDGLLDSEDEDDDNDGCIDEFDDFPQDPAFCVDTDGDGLANEVDDDDDG